MDCWLYCPERIFYFERYADSWSVTAATLSNRRAQGSTVQRPDGNHDADFLAITDHDIPPLPVHDGLAFWDKTWIDPKLKDLVFGQPNEGPALHTYLIVDATLRKTVTGVFDLDAIDAPMRCLFKGDAADDLKQAAPYLVDMTLPDAAREDDTAVPAFHKDFFANHWGANTGIIVRTTTPMDEVWGHFRKFTLVAREGHAGRVFVPFWSEQYVRLYFPHISSNPDRVAQWFLRDSLEIQSLIAEQNGGAIAREIVLQRDLFAQRNQQLPQFMITEHDLLPFYEDRKVKDTGQLVQALKADYPNELKNYSPETISQIIAEPLKRMRGYGFSQKGSLYILASWCIFFGQNFEAQDPSGKLLEFCTGPLSESDKLAALKTRMAEFSVPQKAAQ